MKKTWKFFCFELKKRLWALIVLAAVCALPYIAELSTMELIYVYPHHETGELITVLNSTQIAAAILALGALCYLSPVLVYSFKMSKRGVDAYYALPLKKEKLYLVKTLVGLLLVLVPFTVMYWSGFLTLLFRAGNPYDMFWYLPAYFGSVLLGICLFGLNAFLFTRGNTVADGIVFMIAYIPLFLMIYEYATNLFGSRLQSSYENFITFGGLIEFGNKMSSLISRYENVTFSPLTFVVLPVLGTLGYALLFALLPYEKGENAEQVSDSWFGYKILIPIYTAFLLALNLSTFDIIWFFTIAMAAIVATVVYQRKFKFHLKWWGMIGGALALGLFLGMLIV